MRTRFSQLGCSLGRDECLSRKRWPGFATNSLRPRAIDVFPRCALLLSIFEGMSLEDVATLLNGERDLVRKAQLIGLRELTRNLARKRGWTSTAPKSYVVTSEMQHA